VQWSQVGASAGATNWYGSARQTTGYSDARARGGDWSFSEPMPQSGDHRKWGVQLRDAQYADVDSAQSDQSAGQWQSMQPPLRAESRSWLPRVRPSVRGPGKPGSSTINPALCKTHLLQLLGFEDMILLRTGGLAASPPVRYTLETAEQCRVSTVPLLVSSPRFVQRVARVLASLYAAPPPPSPDWYERTRIKRSPHQWC
jgi:hypothetical protein